MIVKTPKGPIGRLFADDDSERSVILDRAAEAVSYANPSILPKRGQDADSKLVDRYTTVGRLGMLTLSGKMTTALFPFDQLWYEFVLAPEIMFSPDAADLVPDAMSTLQAWALMAQATLESVGLADEERRQRSSFYATKLFAIKCILGTGDVLERLHDDFRLQAFRRDRYVTSRDSCGDVLYHITWECLDPLRMSEEDRERAKFSESILIEKNPKKRLQDIYTYVLWNPQSRNWTIEQEVNGVTIKTTEETISPFFSTPFELIPGEDYGRGLFEHLLGGFKSLDRMERATLDWHGLVSKQTPVLDESSMMTEEDLELPSGKAIRGDVGSDGKVKGLGWISPDNIVQMQSTEAYLQRKSVEMSKALLSESEGRDAERVTAVERQQVAQELQGALGGLFVPIADMQQRPIIRRTAFLLRKKNMIPGFANEDGNTIPKFVQINTLTGLSALRRLTKNQQLLSFTEFVTRLGEKALSKVNFSVLVDVYARQAGIFEPGLIFTDEQMAQFQQEAEAAAARQQIVSKAIDTSGNVAEAQAVQQDTQTAA